MIFSMFALLVVGLLVADIHASFDVLLQNMASESYELTADDVVELMSLPSTAIPASSTSCTPVGYLNVNIFTGAACTSSVAMQFSYPAGECVASPPSLNLGIGSTYLSVVNYGTYVYATLKVYSDAACSQLVSSSPFTLYTSYCYGSLYSFTYTSTVPSAPGYGLLNQVYPSVAYCNSRYPVWIQDYFLSSTCIPLRSNSLLSSSCAAGAMTVTEYSGTTCSGSVITTVTLATISTLNQCELISGTSEASLTQCLEPIVPTYPPIASPTNSPIALPTLAPVAVPTAVPSLFPTALPSNFPTFIPTALPTAEPSLSPTPFPSAGMTESPTVLPTCEPSAVPSFDPTATPTVAPTVEPSEVPTQEPTPQPTLSPVPDATDVPTAFPTALPTAFPSEEPTANPTAEPSPEPTSFPSATPSAEPTPNPSAEPTVAPSEAPSAEPTSNPSAEPTAVPSETPSAVPTPYPSSNPTATPSESPTVEPTQGPTALPTFEPTPNPTDAPVASPSEVPTVEPSAEPSVAPTAAPTSTPRPSARPTRSPTAVPSAPFKKTNPPTTRPSALPTPIPTQLPTTSAPTAEPTLEPSATPTALPTPPVYMTGSFSVSQPVENVTASGFSDPSTVTAFQTAVASTMTGVQPSDVVITSVNQTSSTTRRMLRSILGMHVQAASTGVVVGYTVIFQCIGNNSTQLDIVYASLVQQLNSAVVTGALTTALNTQAAVYNAPALTTAVVTVEPTASTPVIVDFHTPSPTNSPVAVSSASTLSGLGLGKLSAAVYVLCCVCSFGTYIFVCWKRSFFENLAIFSFFSSFLGVFVSTIAAAANIALGAHLVSSYSSDSGLYALGAVVLASRGFYLALSLLVLAKLFGLSSSSTASASTAKLLAAPVSQNVDLAGSVCLLLVFQAEAIALLPWLRSTATDGTGGFPADWLRRYSQRSSIAIAAAVVVLSLAAICIPDNDTTHTAAMISLILSLLWLVHSSVVVYLSVGSVGSAPASNLDASLNSGRSDSTTAESFADKENINGSFQPPAPMQATKAPMHSAGNNTNSYHSSSHSIGQSPLHGSASHITDSNSVELSLTNSTKSRHNVQDVIADILKEESK